MKKFYLIFIFLLMPSLSQGSDDNYVREYLEELRSSRTAVFYSECQLKNGKATLVLPVGEKKGLFIERTNKSVVNSADVSLVNGKWAMEEALGGVYTITRVNNLVNELLSYPFRLLMPENLKQIATSRPTKICLEKTR